VYFYLIDLIVYLFNLLLYYKETLNFLINTLKNFVNISYFIYLCPLIHCLDYMVRHGIDALQFF